MRALVTGANGFVGQHLVRALAARGDEVVALDLSPWRGGDLANVRSVAADVRDADAVARAVAGADVVFHAASRIQTRTTGADEVFDVNVRGTRNLMTACRANGVSRFVYVSSASVVYDGRDVENGEESLPYPSRFHAPYAKTKAQAEEEVLAANDASLATVALRPHIIFGPGDTLFFPAIVSRAKSGRLRAYVGDATKKSDFTYVGNVVDGLIAAGDALEPGGKLAGQAYFITNGEPLPFWEFVGRMLDGLGMPRPRWRVPFPIAYGAAAMREALDAMRGIATTEESLTRFTIRYFTTHHYFSIAKAARDFGYEPRVSIDEGIARTVAAWKAAHGGA
ncbi:MAG TPA: NAD-dependent epimerase/dehydratase family protein [Sandaracinaceae bacterium]